MTENTAESTERVHKVGLFDIRFIIGALVGVYGIILVITGLFVSDKEIDKSDGLNINIVAGICMIVASAAFIIWARMRPIVVEEDAVKEDAGNEDGAEPPAH